MSDAQSEYDYSVSFIASLYVQSDFCGAIVIAHITGDDTDREAGEDIVWSGFGTRNCLCPILRWYTNLKSS